MPGGIDKEIAAWIGAQYICFQGAIVGQSIGLFTELTGALALLRSHLVPANKTGLMHIFNRSIAFTGIIQGPF